MKIVIDYGLPDFDPDKHDPDKVYGFLTYRGIHYAKWIYLKSRGTKNWRIKS